MTTTGSSSRYRSLTIAVEVPAPLRAAFAAVAARVDHDGFVVMPASDYHLSLHRLRVTDVAQQAVVIRVLDDLTALWPLPPCRVVGLERWCVKADRRRARFLVVRHAFGRPWVNFIVELRRRLRTAGLPGQRRHIIPHVTLLRSPDYRALACPASPGFPPIAWGPSHVAILARDPGPTGQHRVLHRTLLGGGAGACVKNNCPWTLAHDFSLMVERRGGFESTVKQSGHATPRARTSATTAKLSNLGDEL